MQLMTTLIIEVQNINDTSNLKIRIKHGKNVLVGRNVKIGKIALDRT